MVPPMHDKLLVTQPILSMTATPKILAPLTNQLVYGESFKLLTSAPAQNESQANHHADNFLWGETADGYQGYVEKKALAPWRKPLGLTPILANQPILFGFSAPDIKSAVLHYFPYPAKFLGKKLLQVNNKKFWQTVDDFYLLESAITTPTTNLGNNPKPDELWQQIQRVLQFFSHTPYLWGGRCSFGVDCSGLVQLVFAAAGILLPRDSTPQWNFLTAQKLQIAPADRQAGDLVFWQGHVGILLEPDVLMHANGFHMRVVTENYQTAYNRMANEKIQWQGIARPLGLISR